MVQRVAVKLKDILPWKKYFQEKLTLEDLSDTAGMFSANDVINNQVSLWQGDITLLKVDAVVNAANSELVGGAGVDGAIHRAAGPELMKECEMLGGCEVGGAKITKGYGLPAERVIHAVGPQGCQPGLLFSAYEAALSLAVENNLRTIAFPCISTGVFGFPREQAAHTALRTCRHFLEANEEKIDRIVFVTYMEEDLKVYESLMQRYFPITAWSSL